MTAIHKVGRDVSAEQYWQERAAAYASKVDGPYHRHRLDVIKALINGCDLSGSTCVDVGCGEGIFSDYVCSLGARVVAFDPNEEMVKVAGERLARWAGEARVFKAGIDGLSSLGDQSVDYVFALNVIAYLSDKEEHFFYRELARVLRLGGGVVVMHSNELFDMFTLNRFTVTFFENHFLGARAGSAVASLLTHPNEPERVSFNVRENPLTYRYKLARYGFEEVQQEFANLHEFPPLLMRPEVLVDIDGRAYANTIDWPQDERWKLMFMCSMFGSRSVLRPGGK